jgi:hypothetical protein
MFGSLTSTLVPATDMDTLKPPRRITCQRAPCCAGITRSLAIPFACVKWRATLRREPGIALGKTKKSSDHGTL